MSRSRENQTDNSPKKTRDLESEGDDLEILDELDEAGAVEITFSAITDAEFEVQFEVTLADMPKPAIMSAIDAPLRDAVGRHAADVRFKRVVVAFKGDPMIPTAAKELTGELLSAAKAVAVTVRRGFGDERVFETPMPDLAVTATTHGDVTQIDVDSANLEAEDIEVLFQPEFARLCADSRGKSYLFCFSGASPAADELRDPLIAAGVKRVAMKAGTGEVVLYDRELEELVSISNVDDRTVIEVAAGKDESTTAEVLAAAIAKNTAGITGKSVHVNFASGAVREQEIACLVRSAATLKPTTLTLDNGDVIWPALLKVASKNHRTALKMIPGSRRNLGAALRRELATISIADQELSFDWPEGMEVDDDLEKILIAAGPASISYTFNGEDREPFWPTPIVFRHEDHDVVVCELNSDAGKPVELVRAIHRHFSAQKLSGKKVDVRINGEGVVSRTMRQTMIEEFSVGGAAQGRIIERDAVDFAFPQFLAVEKVADGVDRIAITPADRNSLQIENALAAELTGLGWGPSSTVRVVSSAEDAMVIDAVINAGAARVILEGESSLQVHPPLFTDVTRDGDVLTITAIPAADPEALGVQIEHELPVILDEQGNLTAVAITLIWQGSYPDNPAMATTLERLMETNPAGLRLDDGDGKPRQLHPKILRTYVDILGRRDAGEPPMVIIGVDTEAGEEAASALAKIRDELVGKRVLVVFREDGREVTGAADNAVVQQTIARLNDTAKATLVYRQQTRRSPAHFEVLASSVDGLASGAKMRDPRTAG